MEMKENAKPKILGKMNSTSEPLSITGVEANCLKKFTIPKIRRTAGKVYLSPCCTNTREYSFIHDTLNQCRLDVSSDLRSSWRFGDTKLVHNEDLEKKFTAKRSEMRESGRHGRELEEHFCFLALPQSEVVEIYKKGISTKASTLKILGNPFLGVYVFRHVDVALNYAHSGSITVESIMIFKILFGKVKKIQPSVDKNKVSLDPSPNFDCHMSRSIPSLKDNIELQAYSSAVYFYEYNILSKPVDKPRQCLPYAIVTVKFVGQKVHLATSLKSLSTGFPKRAERTCSLDNCTVAKRIGKGKDATVIFEHFRKPVDPLVQENCSCNALNSEINPSNNISNSPGNVQKGNISIFETHSGQTEHNLAENSDSFQVHAHNSALSFMPSDTRESINSDLLLNLTYLKNVLSGISAAFPLHNNIGSSTVITSKLIKDPRLTRREESMGKQNNMTGLNEILPLEKSLNYVNSELNLSTMPTNSASSSEVIPGDHAVLTNYLDSPCIKISCDDSQSQAHNMCSKDCDYIIPNKITMAGQCESQGNFLFPTSLSNVVSELEKQKYIEEKSQRSLQKGSIPLLLKQNSEPCNSHKSVNTCSEGYNSHISEESQSSNLKTICQSDHQMPIISSLQKKESEHKCIQNTGKMEILKTDSEDSSKDGRKQNLWKEVENCFTNETTNSPVDNYTSLFRESESLDSAGKKYDQILIPQELEIPKSFTSVTKDMDELDHVAKELQNCITPSVESLSQKHPPYSLKFGNNVNTSFASSQKLTEPDVEKTNHSGVNIMNAAFQDTKDLQANEMLIDTFISSYNIETAHDNSSCSISREHICVSQKCENESVSLENIQRDLKEAHIECIGQNHSLFCDTQLNNDTHLNIDFKEQKDDKDNHNEAKDNDIALSIENSSGNIFGGEKQSFHTNHFTNIDETWENKNCSDEEILNSHRFSSTFNLTWAKKCISAEATLLENEDTVTAINQKDTQNNGSNLEHLASTKLSNIEGSSGCVSSGAAVQIASTSMPPLSPNHKDPQRDQFKDTCSPENPNFGLLVKHRVSDSEIGMDKNKFQDSLHQSIINDDIVIQSLELESEIEIGSEPGDDSFQFQQDTPSHENVLYEEFGDLYETLKSRIDWEALLGSSNWEKKVLKSTMRTEDRDQHYSDESKYFYSSTQINKAKLPNPILLPDLKVTVTNIFRTEFSPTAHSLALKENFCKRISESVESETNKGVEKVPELEIYSQSSGEDSHYLCEDKCDNIRQESELVSKSQISLSFDLSQNLEVNHMSEKQNESLFTELPNITTINNESSSTKSKIGCNDTRSEKHLESRISKRKLHVSFRDQSISHKDLRHHEIYGKKRRLTSQDSSECFSSLSQGRIKTFSQSEKHIRSVLDILNSEASLCKSKRLSRKLDRAVLHLKKAHRRVHTSLQLIAKVGENKKGPLPKSYAIICNNFWESCDLEGYSSMSERKYYSTKQFLSKRKCDTQGEKRALGLDVGKSLTCTSEDKSYKRNEERATKCFSTENVASSVSRSHTTVHMKEFCGQEQHPESLPLFSMSQSTCHSVCNDSSMKNPGSSSELHLFPGETECPLSSNCTDETLPEKENQIDMNFLSNTGKYEKVENHSSHDIKDETKEINSKAIEVVNKSNSVSLNRKEENNVSFSTDKNYEATCIAHTEVKTDILISVLESSVKHFLDVKMYKPDNLILSGCKRKLKVNFPVEKWAAPAESSKPSIITGNLLKDPLNLIASKNYNNITQLSAAPVKASEGESSKSYLDEEGIFAVDCFAESTAVSHEQECGVKEFLKTEQCSSSNCFQIDGNERNVTENSELDLTSVTEENKSYRENIMKKLFSNNSSVLLTSNKKGSAKLISKKDIQDRKIWKDKQVEKGKNSAGNKHHKKTMTEGSAVKTEYKNQKNKILEKESFLCEKTIKNNLIDSHLSIKNTTSTEAISLNNTVPNHLNKREKEGKVKANIDSQSDLTLHSETACSFKPDIIGINHMSVSCAHSETAKVATPQKNPTSYMNEFKEECSTNLTAFIAKLSPILQRADKASSLQILQEETKVCQNILPFFVEAFERNQECSLEEILISRELLVGQNLWNNCKHKLKSCAIDSLVELQMMMETIQFIENKKRLLGGEPTFRSLLWYDETLYSELLSGPRGYQQQSTFYPAFQGRLKYNAFCELQNYHDQLIKLFEETKRENNSYYAFLKYKRQINECEAIMNHCSDCFDFSLSVPFTCSVNLGDSLGDLETIRKSTLELISIYGDSPKVHLYPGKQDHLWIIIEMISSKVNFIKNNEAVSLKISLYGLEHIFFDAAKSLVWNERRQSLSKKYSQKKNKEMLLKMNQDAFSKLQEIYDTVFKDLGNEQISNIGLEEDTVVASRKSADMINKASTSMESYTFNSTLLSHPDICCISEILDQAECADFKNLQKLTLRCTDHLEILKKYFQMLQEDSIDNVFITEENVLDMMKSHNRGAVILKPEAVETYIEIVMLSETVHFLKNSMAKKLDKQRFRGMLWFDLSLLPDLVHCQEKMASFSFIKDNSTDCLWKVIETAISELKKDLDIIYKYSEAVNCSYALHLFSRELEELLEIQKLLKKSKYSVSTYIDFVPNIVSINYGSTVTELEYNYNQFSLLLKNIMATPRKDLGKMAHIMKVMKTIEHMKIVCTKDAELTLSFILYQTLYNRRKALQPKRKAKMDIHVIKPGKDINKSTCINAPSVPECITRNVLNSSKKRSITVDICEDSQEQEKNATLSSCKKQKVHMKDVTKINKEKALFKNPRSTKSDLQNENDMGPTSSDNLKRNHVSPKNTEMQRSQPGLLLPLRNLKCDCMSKSESEIDLTTVSSDISEDFIGQWGNLNSMKKRNVIFGAARSDDKDCVSCAICDQKSIDGTFTKDDEIPSQKFLKNPPDPAQNSCPSNIEPGTDGTCLPNTSVLSKPIFCFVSDVHTGLDMNDPVFELQGNEILDSPIKNSACTNSPELLSIQNKIPALQINKTQPANTESKEKYMKDTLNPSTMSIGASENITLNVPQTTEHSFSEQQNNENSKVLTENSVAYWNELPQSAYTPIYNSSEQSFGNSYPYYAWCVYHYSSSNGNSVTQTYHEITSYDAQPPPSGMLTAVESTVQNTYTNLFYSQYFGCTAGEPQANEFVPVNGYFQSQIPISYNFQQSVFPQYLSYQPLQQAAYPYPPNPDVLPEVPWTYAPWQQEPFQPGH
ncbi:testis-expressed protein 15 isoform X3 [Tamandua tetradactyla]